jgi:hypothetical protein
MRDDLDTLIQASRIEVEASSTMPRTVMVQVQRRSQIRRAQWLFLLLLVLAAAAFVYGVSRSKISVLIEAIINGTAQRSQNLYASALMESLPLIQLLSLLGLILIASLAPKIETILLSIRKSSVTKGSNMAFKVRTSGIIALSFGLAVIAGSIVVFPANGGKELAKLDKVTHGQGVALNKGVDQKTPHVSRPPSNPVPVGNPAIRLKEFYDSYHTNYTRSSQEVINSYIAQGYIHPEFVADWSGEPIYCGQEMMPDSVDVKLLQRTNQLAVLNVKKVYADGYTSSMLITAEMKPNSSNQWALSKITCTRP